jgi:prepilin-type N-terminal cleavage/methylation domain-containing protein
MTHTRSKQQKGYARRGFTILELLIALSLFSILTALSMGTFLRALKMHREIMGFSRTLDAAGQMIEQMSREIRTGYSFEVNGLPGDELIFINARGQEVGYKMIDYRIGKCTETCIYVDEEEAKEFFRPLHGEDLAITKLFFIVSGHEASDGYPPLVIISMQLIGPWGSVVELQTAVSARNIGG